MKIVVLDGYTENPGDLTWEGLEKLGELTVYDRTQKQDTVNRIGDAEAVYTNKTPLTREIMEQCRELKFIGVLATGYNVVDVKAAGENGITVCNVPSYGTDTVAQYTIALLLELCHHTGEHARSVKEGKWSKCPDFCYWDFPMMELKGKTLGLVGYGRIGRQTAKLAESFGMKVLAVSGHTIDPCYLSENIKQSDFNEVLKESHVISLHCPLTEETKGIINRESISIMRNGVLIINDSRGPLIVEEDLRDALISGKVGGAAVDVVSTEPISPDNPLLNAPNMLITPHIAWAAKEARNRLMDTAVSNLKAFMNGKPANVVTN